MSFTSLLVHTVAVDRLVETASEGVASWTWVPVTSGVKCRLDLSFLRTGRDPTFVPESGRQADRVGVVFFPAATDVKPGDRITITSTGGITGTFTLDATLDQVVDRHDHIHHLEAHVTEVNKSIGLS